MKTIAVFCSNQCPGERVLAAYDWARSIREREDLTIIGGFHTVIEKDILEILLRGTCPVIIVPARSIESMRIPLAWRPHIESNRIQLLSPFPATVKRITAKNALRRNDFVAQQADEILIVYASQGGHLEEQSRQWTTAGKLVTCL